MKHDIYRTPKRCPFCGSQPEIFPKNPKEEGNAWAEVACVNEQCRVRPKCRDGATISADGIDYVGSAILVWNRRAGEAVEPTVITDKRGVVIKAGDVVLVHQDDGVRRGVVEETFPDSPTVNQPGYWVDVNIDGKGADGMPSYILEVVAPACAPTKIEGEIAQALAETEQYESCMSLSVSREGKAVELLLDTDANTYGEWITGEGADICLVRCQDTKRVVGVRLPLYNERLVVQHDGPIRINAGFRKGQRP